MNQSKGLIDPIGDLIHHKGYGVIHRYKNKILFLVTKKCAIKCDHCFRQNNISEFNFDLNFALKYLHNNPQISEVILSGGDPFCLNDKLLNELIKQVVAIESINYLRIHTRNVVTDPKTVCNSTLKQIKKHITKRHIKHAAIAIHINTKEEINNDVAKKIAEIKKFGISILSQTVLLKNINNSATDLAELFTSLNDLGVRPYYLHHPDKVYGGMNFQVSEEDGMNIYQELKQLLPGWLVPNYAIDGQNGKKRAFV